MERKELTELILRWKAGKSKRPSKIDRVLTYQLYNELLKPKMRRSEKDCTCLDRDTDYKVIRHIEAHYADVTDTPLPIETNVKIELEGMTKKKTTRKRKTNKKNEGTTSNRKSTKS